MLGHLEGLRGAALLETLWARVLDQPTSHIIDLAVGASQRGLIDFRHAGVYRGRISASSSDHWKRALL